LPLMFCPNLVIGKILGQQYIADPWIARMWGASILCMAVASGIPCILFLARQPRTLTLVRLVSSLVGLPAMLVLIYFLGAKGAVASRLVVESTQAIGAIVATWLFIRASVKTFAQISEQPSPQAC
jgi:hypothetical protein